MCPAVSFPSTFSDGRAAGFCPNRVSQSSVPLLHRADAADFQFERKKK